jgi:sulfate permease, SulP family
MSLVKFNSYLSPISIGAVLGFRTLLGTIALTSLVAHSARVDLNALLANIVLSIALSCIFVSFFSKIPQSVVQPQDGPAVILSTVLAAWVSMGTDLSVYSVLFINALFCFCTACMFWILGRFKLGNAARLLPYPVIGGFLAGSGLLMLLFALKPISQILINSDIDISLEIAKSSLTTIAFVIVTLQFNRIFRAPVAMPIAAIIFSVIINYYIIGHGYSQKNAIEYGWLLENTSASSNSLLISNFFSDINFLNKVISKNWFDILSIAIVSAVSLLLILSSLELTLHREIDINHELRVAGFSNLINSILGGLISFTALSATLLSIEKGDKNNISGIVVAIFCCALYFGNLQIIEYVPKPVINGILILMGYSLIKEWLLKNYKKFGIFDYLTILIISISIVVYGYISGILIGIFISVFIFVFRYSRINIIKYELTGEVLQSRIVRPNWQSEIIRSNAKKIRILKLDGFLFFGTVHTILNRVIKLIDEQKASHIVLDFSLVESLDLAAIETINKASKYAQDHNCAFLIAGANSYIVQSITKVANLVNPINFVDDVDHALEVCEDNIISSINNTIDTDADLSWFNDEKFNSLKKRMKVQEFDAGCYLFCKGEKAHTLYILQDGLVSINTNDLSGKKVRVQTLMKGALIGERSFIANQSHSAHAIAESQVKVYKLDWKDYLQLRNEEPESIGELNHYIIKTLSERLLSADHLIRLLMIS